MLYDSNSTDLAFTLNVGVPPAVSFHHVLEPMLPEQVIKFRKLEGNGQAWVCFADSEGGPCSGTKLPVNGFEEVEYNYIQISNGAGQYLRVTQDGTTNLRLSVRIPGL